MIELNPEQRQAMAQGQPVQIIDPLTHHAYVLVRAEEYARLAGALQQPAAQDHSRIPPLLLRSQQAFWQDLPELLKDKRNRGKWVAYHGRERVAFSRSDVEAYQECFRRGLKHEEFYVGRLEADPDGVPPWGTLEADWSLFEVTEELPPNRHEDPRPTSDRGEAHVAAVWRSVHHCPSQPDPGMGERALGRGARA